MMYRRMNPKQLEEIIKQMKFQNQKGEVIELTEEEVQKAIEAVSDENTINIPETVKDSDYILMDRP